MNIKSLLATLVVSLCLSAPVLASTLDDYVISVLKNTPSVKVGVEGADVRHVGVF
jgi:hypothetical protein